MALTIDDAPHGEVTPYLLDELRRHECRATFFCIGAQVAAAPKALLRRMVDEGHELGNHMMHDMATYNHPTRRTRCIAHAHRTRRTR